MYRGENQFDGPFCCQPFRFQRVCQAKAANRQIRTSHADAIELLLYILPLGDDRAFGGDGSTVG